MKETLIVSAKGQVTLPASLRRALGLGENSILTAEQQGNRIVLTPAIVVETDLYTDEAIAGWQAEDALSDAERVALKARVQRQR